MAGQQLWYITIVLLIVNNSKSEKAGNICGWFQVHKGSFNFSSLSAMFSLIVIFILHLLAVHKF